MIKTLIIFKKILVKLLMVLLMIMMAVLTLDVLWGVFTRFFGGFISAFSVRTGRQPWSFLPTGQAKWTEEVATNLLIWVSLLGASVAFGAKGHLGVDYFVNKLHKDARKIIDIFAYLLTAFFTVTVMIYGGYILVSKTLQNGQVLPALGLKVGYVYLAVPISGIFMLIFCIEHIAEILSGDSAGTNIDQTSGDL